MRPYIIKSTYPNWIAAVFVGVVLWVGIVWLVSLTGCSHVEQFGENTRDVVSAAYSVIAPEEIDTVAIALPLQYGGELRVRAWEVGDSVYTDSDSTLNALFGSRWWKCFKRAFTACANKDGERYAACINSYIAGCTIGDIVVSVCDLLPKKDGK